MWYYGNIKTYIKAQKYVIKKEVYIYKKVMEDKKSYGILPKKSKRVSKKDKSV